jgi:hypothetical protein
MPLAPTWWRKSAITTVLAFESMLVAQRRSSRRVAETVHDGAQRCAACRRECCVRVREGREANALDGGGATRRQPNAFAEVLASKRCAFGRHEHEAVDARSLQRARCSTVTSHKNSGRTTVRMPALVFGAPHTKWPLTSVHCSTTHSLV